MKSSDTAELVLDARATLGEGAIWDARAQVLYWVDILAGRVHIFDPATNENLTIEVGQSVGTIVPRTAGGVMLALKNVFAGLDLDSQELTKLTDPEQHLPDNRFNDGKCDPAGRFWAGTMAAEERIRGAGSLYCLDTNLTVRRMLPDVTVSNGIAWSLDGRTMFYIDSPTREVAAFDFDIASGNISNRRTVIKSPKSDGWLDGMTIDSEGMLWIAHWHGRRVTRWDPARGKLLRTIRVPATLVTSCAFGGPELDRLYITTARTELDDEVLANEPHAGGLFVGDPGVRGVEAFTFHG